MKKTQPMRALEAKRIDYRPRPQRGEQTTAQGVAADLGVPVACVLKAMLVRYRDPGMAPPRESFALFVAPGDQRLSLKKVAVVTGDKNAELASERDVVRITGFKVGSVSMLGLRRDDTPRFVDEGVRDLSSVIISAGRPDMGLELSPMDLLAAMDDALVGDYCKGG